MVVLPVAIGMTVITSVYSYHLHRKETQGQSVS